MKHVDKLFKEKLYNHEVAVPEGMWEKIAPIAEEESGRAILWFWFAGILALLLGSFGMYKMVNTNTSNPTDLDTLVYNETSQKTSDLLVDNTLPQIAVNQEQQIKPTIQTQAETISEEEKSEDIEKTNISENEIPIVKVNTSKISTEQNILTPSKDESQKISNTVESITNVVGTPANLVITKSYINKEGSVIKQSNLTEESGNEGPVFDIILNSEVKDFNAGALLRIIEPLENIPLPAFNKQLKKKARISIL